MTVFERYKSAGVVPPPCHLKAKKPRPIKLDDPTGRAFLLTDPPRGTLREIAAGLDVENSARYRPGRGLTHCNGYARDVCESAGVFLPGSWYTDEYLASQLDFAKSLADKASDPSVALRRIADAEITPGWKLVPFEAVYRLTCAEVQANELIDWLRTWGTLYGWLQYRVSDAVAVLCETTGYVGVICARNRNAGRSGHVTAVLGRDGMGRVVQSQAGRVNRQEFVGLPNDFSGSPGDPWRNWWESSSFAEVGFFAAPRGGEV